nr:ribonuclease III domain-containing protein [uncultured Oscillibacter sp.]
MENYFEPCLAPDQLRSISSIGLAHIGDAVFEILARTWLCAHGGATGRGLHRSAVQLVCAESQARRAERILPLLTQEESAVFRRGRNAHVHTVPGHATRAQYGEATALEALFGWLYLGGQRERVNQLFCVMMEEETPCR